MQKTAIEYLKGPDGKEGYSWSPIKMRCSPISAGCANCWHLRFAKRHAANPTFGERNRAAYAGSPPRLDLKELSEPHNRRKPARIAVQFMGDLFHDGVLDDVIDQVFAVMATAQQHTFLVLTKRPERMRIYLGDGSYDSHRRIQVWNAKVHARGKPVSPMDWPLKNVWMGVSAENQETADKRIPLLIETPAAVRWVSVEPMLGPVDFRDVPRGACLPCGPGDRFGGVIPKGIGWIVYGAETGHGRRDMDARWALSLRGQCQEAGVLSFGKVDSEGRPLMPREMPCPR